MLADNTNFTTGLMVSPAGAPAPLTFDTVAALQNAGGFASHGILLLQPADVAEVVPPGGTLNVFFVAESTETIPAACAFNGIACG